jgi:ribosomal protein S18 acetylase RimI-like enzyme
VAVSRKHTRPVSARVQIVLGQSDRSSGRTLVGGRVATSTRRRTSHEAYRATKIRRVNWSRDLGTVRRLFQDYRQWLADHRDAAASADSSVRMGLGMIDQQIADLPESYSPPRGEILLAFAQQEVVACGALRELEPKVAEIKRIYVRADHRGPGFGPRLTGALLVRARSLGFDRVRVDTLPTMIAAIQFYQDMGFRPISSYWPHPVPGALFFEYAVRKPKPNPRRDGAPRSRRA